MGEMLLKQKSSSVRFLIRVSYIVAIAASCYAFLSPQDEETGREYPPPGAHQLASFILSQMRRNKFPNQPPDVHVAPYRIPRDGKRNSAELTSSIIGLPRNMIDNGKK